MTNKDELKKLKEELKYAENRLPKIEEERVNIKHRLETAEKKHSQVSSQITALRKERQKILVEEGALDDVNAQLKEVRKSEEILEDEITGLSRKLADLDKEEQGLKTRSIEIRKQIFKAEVIRPLVDEYNGAAAALAKVLVRLENELQRYKLDFSSQGKALVFSDPTLTTYGILSLPGMWMEGEEPLPQYFNRNAIGAIFAAEERENTMKAAFPDCKCFRCAHYAGVDQTSSIQCKRLQGIVPHSILIGRDNQKITPETERCKFVTRGGDNG